MSKEQQTSQQLRYEVRNFAPSGNWGVEPDPTYKPESPQSFQTQLQRIYGVNGSHHTQPDNLRRDIATTIYQAYNPEDYNPIYSETDLGEAEEADGDPGLKIRGRQPKRRKKEQTQRYSGRSGRGRY